MCLQEVVSVDVMCVSVLGLDIPKHGEPAYPAEAYGHGWGEKGDSLAGLIKQAVKSTNVFTNQGLYSNKEVSFVIATCNNANLRIELLGEP